MAIFSANALSCGQKTVTAGIATNAPSTRPPQHIARDPLPAGPEKARKQLPSSKHTDLVSRRSLFKESSQDKKPPGGLDLCRTVRRVRIFEEAQNILNSRHVHQSDVSSSDSGSTSGRGSTNHHLHSHSDKQTVSRRAAAGTILAGLVIALLSWHTQTGTAGAFSLFGGNELEKDPIEPFTIYGSVFKKYLIENIVDGKIVSRKKGFTASACINVLEESKETPQLQGVPAGLKVTLIGEPCCAKGEGQSREESCEAPCAAACNAAVVRHVAEIRATTGYIMEDRDKAKVLKSCSSQCFYECTKPGKSISFVLPFRL